MKEMAERKDAGKPVDYMQLLARQRGALRRAKDDEETLLPEPKGEPVVDYLAAAEAWEKVKIKVIRGYPEE